MPSKRPPERLDFGQCGRCPYRSTGSAELCFDCARETIPQVLQAESCETCDIELLGQSTCGNPLCQKSAAERQWEFVWAISRRRGELRDAITSYKYNEKWGWSTIFGRIVAGYLQAHDENMRTFDAIVPSPTYVGDGGRSWGHTERILEQAEAVDPSWPFRADLIVKDAATPALARAGTFSNRARIAETEIAAALRVPHPAEVAGKSILVFDDVFTGGLTLREVARKLRAAGAESVYGLALARQPFGG